MVIELVSAVGAFKASGSKFAVPMLRSLIGFEGQTTRQLGRIERRVGGSLWSPYREALNDLETAAHERLPKGARRECLQNAERCLKTAAAGFEEAAEWEWCSRSSLDVAVIKLAAGAPVEADIWGRRAYRAAARAAEQAVVQANQFVHARLGRRLVLFSPKVTSVLLWGFLALGIASWFLPEHVRMAGVSVSVLAVVPAIMLYIEARHLYTHFTSWVVRRRLKPHLQFLEQQLNASRAVLGPMSESLTSYAIAQDTDHTTGVIRIHLVPHI